LFPHASGRWCKKVRGKFHYFGMWGDPQAALDKWLAEKDYLLAGRPVPRGDGLVVGDACNQFLTAKQARVDSGEITPRSWGDYYDTCERVVEEFGRNTPVEVLGPADVQRLRSAIAKRCGPVRLGNQIGRVRALFKWCFDAELIDKPVRMGSDFRKPARHVIRKARANGKPKIFEPAELRAIITAAKPVKEMPSPGVFRESWFC
jgi:hypothetical protein